MVKIIFYKENLRGFNMAKLLIVDDSTMLRDMLNYALNEGGYTQM